jgi:hypothetical protein
VGIGNIRGPDEQRERRRRLIWGDAQRQGDGRVRAGLEADTGRAFAEVDPFRRRTFDFQAQPDVTIGPIVKRDDDLMGAARTNPQVMFGELDRDL